MKRSILTALAIMACQPAFAFCGFYAGKADTKIYNEASKVVISHADDATVITMASDYKGAVGDFALVVPVPTFIERKQIRTVDPKVITHIDDYSAPRLVEYTDENPCYPSPRFSAMAMASPEAMFAIDMEDRAKALSVVIEAQYEVGAYDILILSAKESNGLITWLNENGYKVPPNADKVVASYLKQNMRFFVAKVNLKRHAAEGGGFLNPLQVSYKSPKFMLPVRLGVVNANGPQELFVFLLSQKGRIEAANYRTVKVPTGMDLPPRIKPDFANFYKAMFDRLAKNDELKNIYMEYAWNMGSCDPCAAEPLTQEEQVNLGAFWLQDQPYGNSFLTRLHVRYNSETFPEDIAFQETADQESFQARYVLRYPATGGLSCPAGVEYKACLPKRQQEEEANLVALIGDSMIPAPDAPIPQNKPAATPYDRWLNRPE